MSLDFWPGTDIRRSTHNGRAKAPEVTPENVRDIFDYDPLTGVLIRRPYAGGRKSGQPITHVWNGYLHVYVGQRSYRAHRVIWLYMTGAWPVAVIDHIDTDTANNRWANLRQADSRRNGENQRRAHVQSKTGLLGASPYVNGRFVACIRTGGKTKHIGYFDTAEEAHAAYVRVKRELHEGCTL